MIEIYLKCFKITILQNFLFITLGKAIKIFEGIEESSRILTAQNFALLDFND